MRGQQILALHQLDGVLFLDLIPVFFRCKLLLVQLAVLLTTLPNGGQVRAIKGTFHLTDVADNAAYSILPHESRRRV